MKAKKVGEGREWGNPRFAAVTKKPLEGALVAVTARHPRGLVRAKIYRAPSSTTVYCAVWIDGQRGIGSAGGGGYHKHSAALDEAIRDAGYELYGDPYGYELEGERRSAYKGPQSIAGRGEGSMETAMKALAKCVDGSRNVTIIAV